MKYRIKTTIRKAAERRGLDTAYKLQTRVGLSPATAARLYRDQQRRVDFHQVERLMEELSKLPEKRPIKCQITELLCVEEWPDEG